MSLRYALLGLLTGRPLSAYEISKQFKESVGFVWFAPDSQIYPQLRRMENDGLIAGSDLSASGRRRREYHVTDEGIAEFRRWLSEPLEYQRERDVAHLRAAYLEWTDAAGARDAMTEHIDFYTRQLAQWTALRSTLLERTNPTLRARLSSAPAAEHDRIVMFKVFAYDGLIARAVSEIAWARSGLELLDTN
jgi:DNA-binding PadR family transcriptional regulator